MDRLALRIRKGADSCGEGSSSRGSGTGRERSHRPVGTSSRSRGYPRGADKKSLPTGRSGTGRALVALAGLCILMAACGRKQTEGVVLARVGSATLDLGALRTAWADTLSGDMQRAALRRVVQNWIEDQLLAQEAVRRGLAEDPAIDHELERLRSQLLANVALERLLPDTFRVSEEEIRAYYEANRDAYRRTEDEVRVQQILVSQRFLAQEIYDRASQGEDFAALAKQYSQGPLAERGGDVGFVPVSYLPEKLRRAVVAARPGSLLRPLPLEDGFLVVKVLALAPAGSYRELDEVRPRIEMELKRRKHEEAYRRLIQELSSRTDVWVNEALLGSDTAGQGSTP